MNIDVARKTTKEVIQMDNSNKWMGAYWLLVLILCIGASLPAMGASSGTTGASFLKVAVGSRPAAMGTAYTAVAEEPYALHYNPAAIGFTDRWDLSAMHQDQFGQVAFDYVGLAAPAIKNKSAWGISFVRMAVSDYARTELEDGAKFTNSDLALTGTYAHRIFKPLVVGISGKIIKQTLAQYTANGWAVDLGAHLKVNSRLSLGASILHIGPKITFIAIGDPLPTTFRVGGAFRLLPRGNLLATMDYWMPKDDSKGLGLGMEYRPNRFVALRGGYQLGTDFTGFNASTYGVTFDFENFGIEYAFVPREKLGDVHRAGINVSFGGKKPQVVAARPTRPARKRERVSRPVEPKVEAPVPSISSAAPTEAAAGYYEPPARQSVPEDPSAQTGSVSDMMSLRRTAPAVQLPVAEEKPAAIRIQPEEPYDRPVGLEPEKSSPATPEGVPAEVAEAIKEERAAAEPAEMAPTPAVSRESREAIIQEKISIASSLMKDKRYQESVAVIRSGLTVDQRNVPLLYLLSECLYKTGEYDQAMEAVNRAMEIIHGGAKAQSVP